MSLIHTIFLFYLSLLSLLYTSKNLSPLVFFLSVSQSRLEPYLFEVEGRNHQRLYPPPSTSCLRCVKLNLPLIIIITFNMYISSIFFEFLPLLAFACRTLHKTALALKKCPTCLNSYPNFDPLTDLQFCPLESSRVLSSSDLIYLFFFFFNN